jgi:hypothetical protein
MKRPRNACRSRTPANQKPAASIRRKVFGKTKQEVRARLKELHRELNAGVRSSRTYSVREAVEDWLQEGLDDTSERNPHPLRGPAGTDAGFPGDFGGADHVDPVEPCLGGDVILVPLPGELSGCFG